MSSDTLRRASVLRTYIPKASDTHSHYNTAPFPGPFLAIDGIFVPRFASEDQKQNSSSRCVLFSVHQASPTFFLASHGLPLTLHTLKKGLLTSIVSHVLAFFTASDGIGSKNLIASVTMRACTPTSLACSFLIWRDAPTVDKIYSGSCYRTGHR